MSSSVEKVDQRIVRGEATRQLIFDAASEVLRAQGGAATTTRAVAERAGVRLSLVHYHFGGKGGLLAALLERENARLLERQRALFSGPEPLAQKWRTACAYLRDDLRSGYARILWELWAAGLADEELARRWRGSMAGWRDLLEGVAEGWAAERGLELPIPARALATLVANAFQGAEVEILAGVSEAEAPHLQALESCADLIEWFEQRS
ncbi:MAG: TetR family transcriptional regulator [Actinobacteria bacterium]|nr:MAG: TetR family transcriptional regulator [Actinomycetota bacterium]